MTSNVKKIIKFDKQKISNLIQQSFRQTTAQYFAECQKVISDKNAFPDFPNQDIVDTGALKSSGQIVQQDGQTQLSWDVPYALQVHEGYTLRNGKQQKARPWTKVALTKMDFLKVFKDNLVTNFR